MPPRKNRRRRNLERRISGPRSKEGEADADRLAGELQPPRCRLFSWLWICAFTDLMDQLLGRSAAAPNYFCCQSALDVVVYRLDYDASQFAFGITFFPTRLC